MSTKEIPEQVSASEPVRHEPYITVGPRWSSLPACSCGWIGRPDNDEGALRRAALAHARRATQPHD